MQNLVISNMKNISFQWHVGADINSAGSQFFIVLDNAPWLDGKYTVFGEVISGFEIVDKIASLETNSQDQPIDPDMSIIEKITIIQAE